VVQRQMRALSSDAGAAEANAEFKERERKQARSERCPSILRLSITGNNDVLRTRISFSSALVPKRKVCLIVSFS
jgi:hypothetical protein